MSRDDLYIILEVGRAASVNEIKRAFRKLARRYHPDINPGDSRAEERFKRITEAYEILSDPVKREFYDLNGFYTESVLEHQSESSWGFSFQGFDFSHRSQSPFGDFFGQLFARQAMRRDPEPLDARVGGSHIAQSVLAAALGEAGVPAARVLASVLHHTEEDARRVPVREKQRGPRAIFSSPLPARIAAAVDGRFRRVRIAAGKAVFLQRKT